MRKASREMDAFDDAIARSLERTAVEHQGLVPVSYKIFPIFALTKPTDLCIQRQNQKMKR